LAAALVVVMVLSAAQLEQSVEEPMLPARERPAAAWEQEVQPAVLELALEVRLERELHLLVQSSPRSAF
jgi:hypothetical protein